MSSNEPLLRVQQIGHRFDGARDGHWARASRRC
jgi:hypothetical protein